MDMKDVSRRDLLKSAAIVIGGAMAATKGEAQEQKKSFKVGLIGCGGRGKGAVRDSLAAGKALGIEMKVVALADAYQDRVDGARDMLAKEGHEVPANRCFVGFDAYRKLIAADADIVLMATSPNFRPQHFAAAIQAGKHVFMEKPVAVDPVGCRKVMEAGKLAVEKKLGVVAGTQRRHSADYVINQKLVAEGAIGRILSGQIYWCMGKLWFKERKQEWDDAEYMVRNWVSFTEMSGDHICEQHVHNIDVANWFLGSHPVSAVGFGGRARRRTGDQFDFFSIDFEYPNGVHIQSMCRQVDGCWNKVGEQLIGEKGTTSCGGKIDAVPEVKMPKVKRADPYMQEHYDLLESIVKGRPLNEAQSVAEATMAAVMGRISAYTGQQVKWDDMMKSDFQLRPSPEDFEAGKVVLPKEEPAVPGKA
ncbi:MAG: Gfo/Idh/MocA family oxidoreductase [Planctomycetota bacterium]